MFGSYSEIINLVLTVGALVLGSYLGIVKFNISTRKDIENGFNKLNEIEKETQDRLIKYEGKLEIQAKDIINLEKMLFEYLKKKDAEDIYIKKDTIQPIINNIIDNQKDFQETIKDFKKDIKNSIKNIEMSLTKHAEEDREFQQKLLDKFLQG